jgi:hypothetical protein
MVAEARQARDLTILGAISATANRIRESMVLFYVVGAIGQIILIGLLALWALARLVGGCASRLVGRLSGAISR